MMPVMPVLMHESGYPEELQVMNLSLNDFRSLK